MEKSQYYNLNLPSRDTDDIADINQISENFRTVDEELNHNYVETLSVRETVEELTEIVGITDQEGIVFGDDSADNVANGKYSISGGYKNEVATKVIGVVEVIKRQEKRFTFVLNGKHQEIEDYINQGYSVNRYATVMSATNDSIDTIWHKCIVFNNTDASTNEVTKITGDLKTDALFDSEYLDGKLLYYMWFPNNPSLGYIDVEYDLDGDDGYVQPWVGATAAGFGNRVVGKGAASFGAGNINNGAHSFTAGAMNEAVTNAAAVGAYNNANAPYSFAGGRISFANGNAAFVYGSESYANGDKSASLGMRTQANGNNSFATNQYTQADGDNSSAFGLRSKTTGKNSLATGQDTEANAENSATFGNACVADGNGSMSAGRSSETGSSASYSFALGRFAKTTKTGECAVGVSNVSDDNTLFSVGNGKVNGEERKNAFQVNKDGTATVQTEPKKDKDVATKKYVDNYKSVANKRYASALKGEKRGLAVRIENAEQNPMDMSINVQISSKNKVPVPKEVSEVTKNGTTFANNGDGTVTVSGTPTSTTSHNIVSQSNKFALPSGTYYFSALPSDFNSSDGYIQLVNQSGGKSYSESGKGVCFTLDKTEEFLISMSVRTSFNGNPIIVKPQIEVGTTKTEFTPFVEDLTNEEIAVYNDMATDEYYFYNPDENGVVGEITVCSSETNIQSLSERVTVTATYNKDIGYAFAELQQAIISLGGNV